MPIEGQAEIEDMVDAEVTEMTQADQTRPARRLARQILMAAVARAEGPEEVPLSHHVQAQMDEATAEAVPARLRVVQISGTSHDSEDHPKVEVRLNTPVDHPGEWTFHELLVSH